MLRVKIVVSILFFLSGIEILQAQDHLSGTITVRKPKDLLPRIAGKNGGEINPSLFCAGKGIYVTTEGITILNYEITYPKSTGEYTLLVEGALIPEQVCRDLYRLKKGEQVNIEKILAEDDLGRKFTLSAMRFEILPDTLIESIKPTTTNLVSNYGREIGMYQLKLAYIPMQKTYIKLGPDSTAFYVYSPGEPIVLNQVLMNNYSRSNLFHGTYSIRGDSIFIDFNPGYCDFDYQGVIEPGGLILQPYDHEGNPINLVGGGLQRFSVLPFSKR